MNPPPLLEEHFVKKQREKKEKEMWETGEKKRTNTLHIQHTLDNQTL